MFEPLPRLLSERVALTDAELAKAHREYDRIEEGGRISKQTLRPQEHINVAIGAMSAALSIQSASTYALSHPEAVVNVYVNGFGLDEAEQVLRVQSFLEAISRGETAKAAMLSIGLTVASETPTRLEKMALADLLGDLPILARIMAGERADGRKIGSDMSGTGEEE